MMPFSTPWTDAPSPDLERNTLQWNWRQRVEFTPESWALGLIVVVDEPEPTIVGVQDLFAKNFVATRVAESGSWLGLAHQGKGHRQGDAGRHPAPRLRRPRRCVV